MAVRACAPSGSAVSPRSPRVPRVIAIVSAAASNIPKLKLTRTTSRPMRTNSTVLRMPSMRSQNRSRWSRVASGSARCGCGYRPQDRQGPSPAALKPQAVGQFIAAHHHRQGQQHFYLIILHFPEQSKQQLAEQQSQQNTATAFSQQEQQALSQIGLTIGLYDRHGQREKHHANPVVEQRSPEMIASSCFGASADFSTPDTATASVGEINARRPGSSRATVEY